MIKRAQLDATARYQAKAYDQIQIRVPKGERELFKGYAEEAGLSLREYIRQACYEKHAKEKKG